MNLKNKKILIIGGDGDLGKEIIEEFKQRGAEVISTYHKNRELCDFKLNVSKEQNIKSAFQKIEKKYKKLNGIVYCPGYLVVDELKKITLNEWEQSLKVNLTGAFLCTKYGISLLENESFFIFITSASSYRGGLYQTAYCASKFGLLGLIESLKLEYPQILINSIAPGAIETKMFEKYLNRTSKIKNIPKIQLKKDIQNRLNGFLTPKEVAKTTVDAITKKIRKSIIIDNYKKVKSLGSSFVLI
ncbi:MAG TPA: SDR family oxidoreductase [Patescibacteria group bacterium]